MTTFIHMTKYSLKVWSDATVELLKLIHQVGIIKKACNNYNREK